MESLLCLAFLLLSLNARPAVPSSVFTVPQNAEFSKDRDPSGKDQLRLAQMKWFASLTVPGYEKLRGKKMNFLEKVSFKLSQKRMKKMIRAYDDGDVTTLEKISWFCKGLLLGPIAVLLAYIFLPEEQRELIKWAWFGFATWVVILGILLLVV